MGLEQDTLHVVVRLPFKRPQGFVEPPPIVWTDEMEHRLRQFMSQKQTDWNYIAEQLGVPSSYLVRKAAFIYETQLRDIHQQLRRSEIGKASATPPPLSSQHNLWSSATSNSSSRSPSRPQVPRPASRTSTVWRNTPDIDQGTDYGSAPVPVPAMSGRASTPPPRGTATVSDSMALSAISNISPRNTAAHPPLNKPEGPSQSQLVTPSPQPQSQPQPYSQPHSCLHPQPSVPLHHSNTPTESESTEESIYKSFTSQAGGSFLSPEHSSSLPAQSSRSTSDDDDEHGFSRRLEKMRLELEDEPAFLPRPREQHQQQPQHPSSSQLLRGKEPDSQRPDNRKEKQALEKEDTRQSSPGPSKPEPSSSKPTPKHEQGLAQLENEHEPSSSDKGRKPKAFGPALQRNLSDDSKEGSTLNSVGSSFSDLSDSSITQSALEDAFLSKLNGSKMSMLAFSRKY